MLLWLLFSFVGVPILTICMYRWMTVPNRKCDLLKNDTKNGVVFLFDKDMDTKFSAMDLIKPSYNAFDTPFKTCMEIRKVPDDVPIKLVLSTKGGSLVACEKIIKMLKRHPAGYVAYICHECYSAGAMLALGAKEIVMGENSYIGKIDPQQSSVVSSVALINYYKLDEKFVGQHNISLVREAENIVNYMNEILEILLGDHESYSLLEIIKEKFVFSRLPHCKLFDFNECQKMGLHVREPTEEETRKYLQVLDD